MKNLIYANKIILSTGILLLTISSCKNEPKHQDSVKGYVEGKETKSEANDIANDASFLKEAAEINLVEVEIGKLALQKSTRKDVKDYARMLIDDHTKALDDLQMLASLNTITLPSSISAVNREKYNELNESGKGFDEKFIDMMVEDHQKDADKMTHISQKAKNEDFKLWASRQTSTFLNHYEEAKMLKEKN